MSGTVQGVAGEDREDYTREESRVIRRRSGRLLLALLRPLGWRLLGVSIVVVAQTGFRVLGPALLTIGLNTALPAVIDEADWGPTWLVVGAYALTAVLGAGLLAWYDVLAARITQNVLLDLRLRVFRHTQLLSLEFHEQYTSGGSSRARPAISRPSGSSSPAASPSSSPVCCTAVSPSSR